MSWTLVTGGAKRLGAEICVSLAAKGFPILVHYNKSEKEARQVVERCRAFGVAAELIQGDFSSKESLEAFIADCRRRFPAIKNLINNVGDYLVKKASDTTLEEWLHLWQNNLNVPFALSQAFLPSIRQSQGAIINIGVTGVTHMRIDMQRAAYKMAKTALYMLTRTLARELAPDQVRVNMVSPGYLENAVDLPDGSEKLPMGRPATLQEVCRVITFVLAERYITGQNIEVGGALGL